MLVGIHKDPYGNIPQLSQKFVKILEYNNIDYILMHSDDKNFWKKIPEIDLFIYNWGHEEVFRYHAKTILPIIEYYYGVKCFPDQKTCWHYDDKVKQYLMLKAGNFPVVESWFFTKKENAMNWARNEAKYPLVFKLTGGAGSSNVILLKNEKQAKKIINKLFNKGIYPGKIPSKYNTKNQLNLKQKLKKEIRPLYLKYIKKTDPKINWSPHKNYFYCQKFLPNNNYDTRVTTIGNRAFAFRRFVRKNDFRASGSDNWSLDRSKIDMRMIKIAKEISNYFKFQVMAYDFIYDENNEPAIVEISYTYGDYPEFSTGYINDELSWVDGNYWTQYLELVDALKMPELKQPYMKPEGHYANVLNK